MKPIRVGNLYVGVKMNETGLIDSDVGVKMKPIGVADLNAGVKMKHTE